MRNFSESIEVCSKVLTDRQPDRDEPFASQAASFIEGALSMYIFRSLGVWQANVDPEPGSLKAG
jgi:hypothetical protein